MLQISSRETSFWCQVLLWSLTVEVSAQTESSCFKPNYKHGDLCHVFGCLKMTDSHYLCAGTLLQSQQGRCFVVVTRCDATGMVSVSLCFPHGWNLAEPFLSKCSSENSVSEYGSRMNFSACNLFGFLLKMKLHSALSLHLQKSVSDAWEEVIYFHVCWGFL